jgi:predicted HicB family RNase H-like nuclease
MVARYVPQKEVTMKTEHLHIRISDELKQQAQTLADADGRNLTNWVEWLIKKEIEKASK